MPAPGQRRRLLLFLVAIMLPCLGLAALGVRLLRQERELADKRLAEEQRRLATQVRQELIARLERIKLQEVGALASSERPEGGYTDPSVVLVGRVEDRRLRLPWEVDEGPARFRTLLDDGPFARAIGAGEQAELIDRDALRAVRAYSEAEQTTRDRLGSAYARLLQARALVKAGRSAEAAERYRALLALTSDLVDDQGIPLPYYAAGRLIELGRDLDSVRDRLGRDMARSTALAPAAAYMLRDLVKSAARVETARRLEWSELERRLAAPVADLEQALALQADFPNLLLAYGASADPRQPSWFAYGREAWLVSISPAMGSLPPAAIAVRAGGVFAAIERAGASDPAVGTFALTADRSARGDALGENLAGVRIAFAPASEAARSRLSRVPRTFYLGALALVVGLTLFGGYLLWRDVRREIRLAELRSQFVSSVSHELKTPLTAIRMFAETLQLGRAGDERVLQEYLETIVNETERLTRLLNNVLDFSKIERGQKFYHPVISPIGEIAQAAARAAHYPLEQQGFRLQVDIEEAPLVARVDRDAIEQAILNLLTNAMKYSGENRDVWLRVFARGGEAVIEVEDHGVGIAPQEHARIFEKFYRVPTPENRLIPGTGLGLALVAHVVKAHGGRVEVRSAPGQGSTFAIHLPLAQCAADALEARESVVASG